MVAPSTTTSAASAPAANRLAAVQEMARLQRILFEVEREFTRTATTLIYRVGEPELKYLLCQHVWESAGHARFLRERGREMSGFGSGESVRDSIRRIFNEAAAPADGYIALAGFYGVLKPALLAAYRHYLEATHHLADWPSRKLVEEFVADEERHAREIAPYLVGGGLSPDSSGHKAPPTTQAPASWSIHLSTILADLGGFLGERPRIPLPADFSWKHTQRPYTHPPTCNRGKYPTCSSVFGHDADETPIVRPWLEDPKTDARVIRLMVYVWLMMEMDAVDYLATVFYDTPTAPFDLHFDLARHLWDESRHSEFGYRQLPKLGVDLMTLEHSLELYNVLVHMTPPERYAMMTMEFEAGSFPTKAHVMDRIRELNDFEADTLLAFDRNDEQNHVRYGHHWLPTIMGLFGETRPVEDFVKATQEKFRQLTAIHGNKTPHALPPEKRLTGNKILKLAAAQ
ncbi:MAG: DUF455 family protein [Verrucomicrobia bacterium]|nr:DUF455 family protein [Verrucomicrobiota bacterium]